jgi:hypothetical protein
LISIEIKKVYTLSQVFFIEAARLDADVCNAATDVEVLEENPSSSAILLFSPMTMFSFEFKAALA